MPSIRELNKELQAKAEKELNEKPDRLLKDLEALKEWIVKTPHLNPRTDDQFLVTILRGSKFSLERAKEKLDNYYAIRGAFPEYYSDRFITDDFLAFIRLGVLIPLPQTDGPDGPRIFIYRSTWDPAKLEFAQLYKFLTILYQMMALEDDNLIVAGAVFLIDCKEMQMVHFTCFTPAFLSKVMTSFEQGQAFRIKGYYDFNVPSFAMKFISGVKLVVSEKLKSRVSALFLGLIFNIFVRRLKFSMM